jgi:hypothetical protein
MNYQELIHSPTIRSQIISLTQGASHNKVPVFIQWGTGQKRIRCENLDPSLQRTKVNRSHSFNNEDFCRVIVTFQG